MNRVLLQNNGNSCCSKIPAALIPEQSGFHMLPKPYSKLYKLMPFEGEKVMTFAKGFVQNAEIAFQKSIRRPLTGDSTSKNANAPPSENGTKENWYRLKFNLVIFGSVYPAFDVSIVQKDPMYFLQPLKEGREFLKI